MFSFEKSGRIFHDTRRRRLRGSPARTAPILGPDTSMDGPFLRRKLGELLDQAIGNRTARPVEGREDQRTEISDQKMASESENLTCCPLTAEALSSKARGIEYARRLLGHTNISTTQRYMHLDDKELAEAQDLIE